MHLCMASSIRAMPEKEKPPAMRVDLYFFAKMAVDLGLNCKIFFIGVWDDIMTKQKLEKWNAASVPVL